MKTTAPTTSIQRVDPFERAERFLTEAGISFTVVERCPDSTCEVCSTPRVPAAA